jgi:hypothetical protein
MAKLLAENPRAGDWHVVDRPVLRSVCPQVAAHIGKIARTRRRTELRGDIAKRTDAIPASVGTSDPASAALSASLAALLGVRLPASAIAQWLLLVPALALELGAALAVVLVEATAAREPNDKAHIGVSDRSAIDRLENGQLPRSHLPKRPTASAIIKCDKALTIGQPDESGQGQRARNLSKDRGRRLGRPGRKATTAKKRSVRANTTAQTRILDANRPQAAGSKGGESGKSSR